MRVGFVGLGKLGLPVALAVENAGHEVLGFDVNPAVADYLEQKQIPFKEEGIEPLLANHSIRLASVARIVKKCDVIFMPIQTPHAPQFEGSTRIPAERADFDYSHLKQGIAEVAKHAKMNRRQVTLVVISTCLPGTYERELKPLLNEYVNYVYNPFFIAMGTVLADFTNPEFVLVGAELEADITQLAELYASIHERQLVVTDITTAEGIKVFYNTFITMKTVLANTYGEMAHKLGMNVDHIYTALSMATDRIISPKYLKAGMGDGGGCHPRDNIALSYIAQQVGLSHNIFEDLMAAREAHAEFLADEALKHGQNILVLGRAFKPQTNIETGSPAVLVANILLEKGATIAHAEDVPQPVSGVVLIGTEHERYKTYAFAPGTVVIDPFGFIPNQDGVTVVRIGR